MKVVIASLATEEFLSDLSASFPEIQVVTADTREEQKVEIKDADVYLGFPSQEVFLEADHLRWIQHCGNGYR